MPTLDDYPFDPSARSESLNGLEKLRAVPDRSLAALLFQLWHHIDAADRDGRTREWKKAEEKARDVGEMRDLKDIADKALAGAHGPAAKALAYEMLHDSKTWGNPRRTDRSSLVAFRNSLQELRRHS